MALRLYNTWSKKKDELEPLEPGKIGMYVCGVTVYDTSHIGHARCYVAFDVIYRYLKYRGLSVKYVRNFTDVDDKIIKRANELGIPVTELADRNIKLYHDDMDALCCARPDVEPRVTEHVPQIIDLIEHVLKNGHGYATADGSVYFSIDSFPGYCHLSRRNLEDMLAGASERVETDTNKKNPLDFVLWKPSKEGEPAWDSPWGKGRPGWHIECSAMSAEHLGKSFDIHGGGKDLVFPHHENEIAQSEAAWQQKFVKYWMHNGFVNVDEEKMSKSLGNFFSIKEVLSKYHPESVRTFLLSTHYRSPINYSSKNLDEATGRIEYMYETLLKLDRALEMGGNEGDNLYPGTEKVKGEIEEAMDDDFNSAAALGHLFELFRAANEWSGKKKKLQGRITTLRRMREVITQAAGIFGILEKPPAVALDEIRSRDTVRLELDVDWIEGKLADRTEARRNRDFAAADGIRDELLAQGITVQDSPEGTTWRVART